jgi:hypothetical protein
MHAVAGAAALILFAGGGAEPPADGWTTVPTTTSSSYGWQVARPHREQRPPPAPVTPAPTSAPAPPPTQPRATPTPHRPRPKPIHRATPKPRLPKRVVQPQRTGAVLGAKVTEHGRTYVSALVLAALGLAIACFAAGATPAEHVRWRRGAVFVAYRRTSVTVAGGLFLLGAAVLLAAR